MTLLDAAERVLQDAGEPLRVAELTERILLGAHWSSGSKTPAASVEAGLSADIKRRGAASRFVRVAARTYALRAPTTNGVSVTVLTASPQPDALPVDLTRSRPKRVTSGSQTNSQFDRLPGQPLTFLDAAEHVLRDEAGRRPMHYREITRRAMAQGMIATSGQTPGATMYAQLLTDIQRRQRRGETPRFARLGPGQFGLHAWEPTGLAGQIGQHNQLIHQELHRHIQSMPWLAFEVLVERLLGALGFDAVQITRKSGDGGIDVRGTLVVGDAVRIQMAVQVKRWRANVQAPIVQQVRGSLGVHEQGLIITSGDFSMGARTEAASPGKTPVGLMNGEQLVRLLVENDILVRRTSHDLLELDPLGLAEVLDQGSAAPPTDSGQ